MITNYLKRKIAICLLIIIVLIISFTFPKINTSKTNYINVNKMNIYLPTKYHYVSELSVSTKETNLKDIVKNKISYLTINSRESNYLPSIFNPIIPENTEVLDLTIDNDIIKINFSKELLNISEKYENSLIESIIYTLTDNKEINEVMIFVEGNLLTNLPNSNIPLPTTLNRNYGINKIYQLDNIKNSQKTTIYYLSKEDDLTYYTPITLVNNDTTPKIEIIINELKSNTINGTNLISYLEASTNLLNYEILENQINLSFNAYIFDNLEEKSINEEVKYSINQSILDNYHISKVNYLYDNTLITSSNT